MTRDYLLTMRKLQNEAQSDVARAIGVSRQYYQMIEDGSRQKRMDISTAILLSEHFGISFMEIVKKEQDWFHSFGILPDTQCREGEKATHMDRDEKDSETGPPCSTAPSAGQ